MLTHLRKWLASKLSPAPAAAAPQAPAKRPLSISRRLLEELNALSAAQSAPRREYKFPELPPGVIPDKVENLKISGSAPVTLAFDGGCKEPERMALDNGGTAAPAYGWLNNSNGFGTGLWFPGYPYLAELTQISEYRAPSETTSTEMCRKWVELNSKDGGDKSDVIAQLTERMKELKVRELFQRAALLDGFFGRAQIYLNIDDADDAKRQLPLEIIPEAIKKGSLKSITCIEPYWSTPYSWNSSYPEREDFYKPQSWYIMGRKTHTTRLLTFIAREVPDILKPSYNFGGISLTQLMEPYVNMWLRTRKSVNDLVNGFSIPVLSTDLNATLEEGGAPGTGLIARGQLLTQTRNNLMLAIVNKDSEEFDFKNAPLSGLDALQAQSQEHMAAPCHIPLVKLFGVTPTGLNATSEGEIQVWYDFVHAMQENLYGPQFDILLKVLQLDLFGAIDEDITYHWVELDQPTAKELADMRKSDADAGVGYINAGVIDAEEERERLQSDPLSGYDNLNGPAPEPQPEPGMDPETGLPLEPEDDGSEGESEEKQKDRDHEADQNDLQRKHELALADKKKPAVPIKAKTAA
jgi:uncharacterized protein